MGGPPGYAVEEVHVPVPYDPSGVILLHLRRRLWAQRRRYHHARVADHATSGNANIRTGGPGQISRIQIGSGFVGNGHKLDAVKLHFECGRPHATRRATAKAPTALILVDVGTSRECQPADWRARQYSWDRFVTYSPPISFEASGLEQDTEQPLALVLGEQPRSQPPDSRGRPC